MDSIPRNPIVDTGPLFDFLLWRFSESRKIPIFLSKIKYLHLDNDFKKKSVHWYLTVAKPITTCPEVIAEIHRHAEQNLRGELLGNFWKFTQKELAELGLSEKLVELVKMDGDMLSSFGPTDTALLQIAIDNPSQRVFTGDEKLVKQCQSKQVSVLRIPEVLSIWQQYGSK